jgi:MFS family permease
VKKLPRTVWALGFVSLFMDISSEMVHSLLPVFLWSVLQANTVAIGLIEGAAEATALISRAFSGIISDRLKKRKPLIFAGYALGALTKPFFATAGSIGVVFGARLTDRIGKGIRGAPRDALVADVTDGSNRGAAYGLRQSLDTIGAVLGPLLAAGLMVILSGNFRVVFWIAVIPGLFAAAIVIVAVKEPKFVAVATPQRLLRWHDAGRLGNPYWLTLTVGTIFNLARFSEAFLLLRAQHTGVSAAAIPLILVLMNLVYALTAYPVGHLSDRIGTTGLMAVGLVLLVAANLSLFAADTGAATALGAALWGLHLGFTQGVLSAMIAAAAPQTLRGTAFGIFGLVSGLAVLAASLIAGGLWNFWGPSATFLAGACIAAVALIGFLLISAIYHNL